MSEKSTQKIPTIDLNKRKTAILERTDPDASMPETLDQTPRTSSERVSSDKRQTLELPAIQITPAEDPNSWTSWYRNRKQLLSNTWDKLFKNSPNPEQLQRATETGKQEMGRMENIAKQTSQTENQATDQAVQKIERVAATENLPINTQQVEQKGGWFKQKMAALTTKFFNQEAKIASDLKEVILPTPETTKPELSPEISHFFESKKTELTQRLNELSAEYSQAQLAAKTAEQNFAQFPNNEFEVASGQGQTDYMEGRKDTPVAQEYNRLRQEKFDLTGQKGETTAKVASIYREANNLKRELTAIEDGLKDLSQGKVDSAQKYIDTMIKGTKELAKTVLTIGQSELLEYNFDKLNRIKDLLKTKPTTKTSIPLPNTHKKAIDVRPIQEVEELSDDDLVEETETVNESFDQKLQALRVWMEDKNNPTMALFSIKRPIALFPPSLLAKPFQTKRIGHQEFKTIDITKKEKDEITALAAKGKEQIIALAKKTETEPTISPRDALDSIDRLLKAVEKNDEFNSKIQELETLQVKKETELEKVRSTLEDVPVSTEDEHLDPTGLDDILSHNPLTAADTTSQTGELTPELDANFPKVPTEIEKQAALKELEDLATGENALKLFREVQAIDKKGVRLDDFKTKAEIYDYLKYVDSKMLIAQKIDNKEIIRKLLPIKADLAGLIGQLEKVDGSTQHNYDVLRTKETDITQEITSILKELSLYFKDLDQDNHISLDTAKALNEQLEQKNSQATNKVFQTKNQVKKEKLDSIRKKIANDIAPKFTRLFELIEDRDAAEFLIKEARGGISIPETQFTDLQSLDDSSDTDDKTQQSQTGVTPDQWNKALHEKRTNGTLSPETAALLTVPTTDVLAIAKILKDKDVDELRRIQKELSLAPKEEVPRFTRDRLSGQINTAIATKRKPTSPKKAA